MLRVNALTGFGGGIGPVSIEGSIAGDIDSTDSTTHSMSSFDVGVSNAGKRAIMLVTANNGAAFTIDDVTVGGVSLTQRIAAVNAAGERVRSEIWSGDISSLSGSQAIVITTNIATDSAGVSGVSVHNLRSLIPDDTASDQSDSATVATLAGLSGPGNGIVLGLGAHAVDNETATWSSLTETSDAATGAGAEDHSHTTAWDLGARVSADETITWTGAADNISAVGASFR